MSLVRQFRNEKRSLFCPSWFYSDDLVCIIKSLVCLPGDYLETLFNDDLIIIEQCEYCQYRFNVNCVNVILNQSFKRVNLFTGLILGYRLSGTANSLFVTKHTLNRLSA